MADSDRSRMAYGDPKKDDAPIKVTDASLPSAFAIAASAHNSFRVDPSYTFDFATTIQTICDLHEVGNETELEDGRVAGHCVKCGDRVVGRRMVGGLGLARLKAALVDALGDEGAMASLADELGRVEMMLELEEQGLEDARRLIGTAKRMIEVIVGRGPVE